MQYNQNKFLPNKNNNNLKINSNKNLTSTRSTKRVAAIEGKYRKRTNLAAAKRADSRG